MRFPIFSFVVMLFVLPNVFGVAFSHVLPVNNTALSGTVTFIQQVNVTPGEGNATVYNLTVLDTSNVVMCRNSSAAQSNDSVFNITCQLDTTAQLENASIRYVTNLTNSSGNIKNLTGLNYTISNVAPSVNWTTAGASRIKNNDFLNLSVGAEVKACTFYFGTRSFTGTIGASSCFYQVTLNNPNDGSYLVRVDATDDSATTVSTNQLIIGATGGPIQYIGGGGGVAVPASDVQALALGGSGSPGGGSNGLVLLAVIIGGLWYFNKKR